MTTLILRISAYLGVAYMLERTFCIISVMYVCACVCQRLPLYVGVWVCVCVRRLIVVVVVIVAAGLLMKVCVIKSVH